MRSEYTSRNPQEWATYGDSAAQYPPAPTYPTAPSYANPVNDTRANDTATIAAASLMSMDMDPVESAHRPQTSLSAAHAYPATSGSEYFSRYSSVGHTQPAAAASGLNYQLPTPHEVQQQQQQQQQQYYTSPASASQPYQTPGSNRGSAVSSPTISTYSSSYNASTTSNSGYYKPSPPQTTQTIVRPQSRDQQRASVQPLQQRPMVHPLSQASQQRVRHSPQMNENRFAAQASQQRPKHSPQMNEHRFTAQSATHREAAPVQKQPQPADQISSHGQVHQTADVRPSNQRQYAGRQSPHISASAHSVPPARESSRQNVQPSQTWNMPSSAQQHQQVQQQSQNQQMYQGPSHTVNHQAVGHRTSAQVNEHQGYQHQSQHYQQPSQVQTEEAVPSPPQQMPQAPKKQNMQPSHEQPPQAQRDRTIPPPSQYHSTVQREQTVAPSAIFQPPASYQARATTAHSPILRNPIPPQRGSAMQSPIQRFSPVTQEARHSTGRTALAGRAAEQKKPAATKPKPKLYLPTLEPPKPPPKPRQPTPPPRDPTPPPPEPRQPTPHPPQPSHPQQHPPVYQAPQVSAPETGLGTGSVPPGRIADYQAQYQQLLQLQAPENQHQVPQPPPTPTESPAVQSPAEPTEPAETRPDTMASQVFAIQQMAPDKKTPVKRGPRAPKDPNAPKAARTPRAPKDPNAPKATRAPRKPKDPNAPKPPRAPRVRKPKAAATQPKSGHSQFQPKNGSEINTPVGAQNPFQATETPAINPVQLEHPQPQNHQMAQTQNMIQHQEPEVQEISPPVQLQQRPEIQTQQKVLSPAQSQQRVSSSGQVGQSAQHYQSTVPLTQQQQHQESQMHQAAQSPAQPIQPLLSVKKHQAPPRASPAAVPPPQQKKNDAQQLQDHSQQLQNQFNQTPPAPPPREQKKKPQHIQQPSQPLQYEFHQSQHQFHVAPQVPAPQPAPPQPAPPQPASPQPVPPQTAPPQRTPPQPVLPQPAPPQPALPQPAPPQPTPPQPTPPQPTPPQPAPMTPTNQRAGAIATPSSSSALPQIPTLPPADPNVPLDPAVMEQHMRALVDTMRFYQQKDPNTFHSVWESVRKESAPKPGITAAVESCQPAQNNPTPTQRIIQAPSVQTSSAPQQPTPEVVHHDMPEKPTQIHQAAPEVQPVFSIAPDKPQPAITPVTQSSVPMTGMQYQRPQQPVSQDITSQSPPPPPPPPPQPKVTVPPATQTTHTISVQPAPVPRPTTPAQSTPASQKPGPVMTDREKQVVTRAASDYLQQVTGKVVPFNQLLELLDRTTNFVSLCEYFEKELGMVFERGDFAKHLLHVVQTEKAKTADEAIKNSNPLQEATVTHNEAGKVLGEVQAPQNHNPQGAAVQPQTAPENSPAVYQQGVYGAGTPPPGPTVMTPARGGTRRPRGRPRRDGQPARSVPKSAGTLYRQVSAASTSATASPTPVPTPTPVTPTPFVGKRPVGRPRRDGLPAGSVPKSESKVVRLKLPLHYMPPNAEASAVSSIQSQPEFPDPSVPVIIEDSPSPPAPFDDFGTPMLDSPAIQDPQSRGFGKLAQRSPTTRSSKSQDAPEQAESKPSLVVKLKVSRANQGANLAQSENQVVDLTDQARPSADEVSTLSKNSGEAEHQVLAVSQFEAASEKPPSPPASPEQPQSTEIDMKEKYVPRIPWSGPLSQPLDRTKARRISKYSPTSIARNILIVVGRHPTEPGLNAHLQPLRENIPLGINWKTDLASIRWDVLDPSDEPHHNPHDAGAEADDEADEPVAAPAPPPVPSSTPQPNAPPSTMSTPSTQIKRGRKPRVSSSATPHTTTRATPSTSSGSTRKGMPPNTTSTPASAPPGGPRSKKPRISGPAAKNNSKSFKKFACAWKDCRATLHNIEALTRHVHSVHAKINPLYNAVPCLWGDCMQPTSSTAHPIIYDFSNEETWRAHMKMHLDEVQATLGPGPAALPSGITPPDLRLETQS